MPLSTIGSNQITDGAIAVADVADGSITTAKIADDAITTAKVANDAITTAKVNPAQTDITSLGTLTSITVGDGHTIGNQSSSDNLELKSSSGENIVYNSENGSHIYYKNGVENFRINDDGEARFTDNIRLTTSGKGIYLGVTSATASNLLDDYEEGTFTPTWSGYASSKLNSTSGRFVKIGNHVTVFAKLVTGTSNDASSVGINNLPFTISGDLGTGSIYHNTAGLRDMHIVTDFTANSTSCSLHGVLSGSDTTIKYVGTSPALGGSSTLIWTLIYQTI